MDFVYTYASIYKYTIRMVHVVSSSSVYFHFLRLCLQRPIFVRSLFRHLHSVHVPDAPLARHSLLVCGSLWGTDCRC